MLKNRIHYAWVICFSGLLLTVCNIGLCSNILTIYLPFIEATGISGGAGSAILSVRCFASFVSTFLVGMYYQRFSLRLGAVLATIMGAAAYVVFSLGGSVFVYYVGAAFAGLAYGLGGVIPMSLLITNWFRARRGFAIGICSAGSGLATVVFAPLLTKIILAFGLRTAFLIQMCFMAACAVVVLLLIKDRPDACGRKPLGEAAAFQSGSGADSQLVIPRSVWLLLAVIMLLSGGAGLSFSGHLSVLTKSCGYSADLAARVVSVFGALLIVGKLLFGAVSDRIGTLGGTVIFCLIFILGCFPVFGMNGENTLWCFLLAVMLGFGAPMFNIGPSLWSADLASRQDYARMLKWLQIFYNLGGIIFTAIPGMIADRTGEYRSSFMMFAVMMTVMLLLLLYIYCRRKKEYR